mgnify:CR=1 FL=1
MTSLPRLGTPASPWQRAGVLVLTGLAGLLLFRIVLLMLLADRGVGLHVDEAQYWWWSRNLQWGYFSKPPGIAALISLSTALFGDSVVATAILDRLLHHSHVITIRGDSYRLREKRRSGLVPQRSVDKELEKST